MIRRLRAFSPAKVNLHLSVAGRRTDGFHELVSLAAPLDFGDEIELTVEEGTGNIALECDDPQVPTGAGNIAVRAAAAFLEKTRFSNGVTIRLQKRIPMGAGLGGGSSNAATVLRGLNDLHDSPLSENEVHGLAAALGSDCPLFLAGGPCVMRGRGDIIEPVGDEIRKRLGGQRIVLFKPDFSINTGWAYEKLATSRRTVSSPQAAGERLENWFSSGGGIETVLFNTFEEVVFNKFVALPVLMDRLKAESSVAGGLLSGSGSACFILLSPGTSSNRCEDIIRDALGETAFCRVVALS